jgi:Ca-activated chloride channel family protein
MAVMIRKLLAISLASVSLSALAQTQTQEQPETQRESPSSWWKTPDQQGAELLESGDAARASEVFRDPSWRGISHFRSGNFAEAQKEFSTATDATSLYNAGTAAAKGGDYQAAVDLFEKAVESDPTNDDAAHNLDIAKQLLNQQQSNQSQQGEGDSDNDGNEQQSDQQQGDDQQQKEGDSQQESQQGDSESGDQQSQDSDSSDESDRGGDLSTSKDDAEAQQQSQQQAEQETPEPQGADEQSRPTDPEQQSGQSDAVSADAEREATQPISESEQATEQWMRRIPDDPSQLLRNKIKLNHMIQHENVTDLPEPW